MYSVERRPRLCVVDAGRTPPYDRLDECAVDIMAVVPRLSEVDPHLVSDVDVVLVACSDSLLLNRSFARRAVRIAAITRLLGTAVAPAPEIAAHAVSLGFRGFVARDVSPPAFERTLQAVLRGELAFPHVALTAVASAMATRSVALGAGSIPLTERQVQIVELIADGAHDRDIAERLRISRSTVQKHVHDALRRTGAKTRSQLVASLGRARSRSRPSPVLRLVERQPLSSGSPRHA